jgi:hypothetical protein
VYTVLDSAKLLSDGAKNCASVLTVGAGRVPRKILDLISTSLVL